MAQISLLMVCLGNICRSPLAEGILRSKLPNEGFLVDSAGTGAWHVGNPPDPRSIAIAEKHGIMISEQRARQFTKDDFETFDHIFVMDKSNYSTIASLAPTHQALDKVSLILEDLNTPTPQDVPDPYYGGISGFEDVYDLLNSACNLIASRISA